MRAFIAVPGGYACELESAELRIIARVAADTCELLGVPIAEDDDVEAHASSPGTTGESEDDDAAQDPSPGATGGSEDDAGAHASSPGATGGSGDDAVAQGPPSGAAGGSGSEAGDAGRIPSSASDEAVLAALDWDPAVGQTPRDPALARLLPPASTDDEELAAELRRLTEGALRTTKAEQLSLVHRALTASSGVVVVRHGQERAWLAALTDIRLVLASRLGIETDEDAERVYQRAGSRQPQSAADEFDAALTSLYAALTWWQESLLEAMSRRAG